jgi:hypothetical protein
MWVSLKVVLNMPVCNTSGEKTFSKRRENNLLSSVSLEGFQFCSYSFNRKYHHLKSQFLQNGENFSDVVRKSHVIEAMKKNIFLRVAIYIYIHIYILQFCLMTTSLQAKICSHVVQQSSLILSIKVVLTELTLFSIL